MRYLIVTYDDYFNIPYIKYYEECLRDAKVSYDIVFWNRSGRAVDLPNAYVFSGKDSHSKVGKVLPFLRWRKFVLQILKKNTYDRLIILTTIPAVLIADQLLKHYRSNYWLDIRDYTYEYIPIYKKLVGKLVCAANAVGISSQAFRGFLPESDHIFLTHNISNQDARVDRCDFDSNKTPLKIGFVGGIQFIDQNQMLLQQFANHPKYIMKYVGKAHLGCDLQPFCKEKGIENAEFLPAFTNDQKPDIYKDVQLINSVYGNDSPIVRLALPNRLYDCALFKKPILVSTGTYLADVVKEYHLGVPIDLHKNAVDTVEEYLMTFDVKEFEDGCQRFLEKVDGEIRAYKRALEHFCKKEV